MVVSTYGPNDFVPILVANRRAVVGDTPKRFFRHFGMKQTHSVPAVYGAIARPLAAITFARFYHAIMNIVVDGPDGQLESTVKSALLDCISCAMPCSDMKHTSNPIKIF